MIGILLLDKESKTYQGIYKLIQEPYCRKCCKPGAYTKKCTAHKNMYGFHRLYVMGTYSPKSGREDENDLLPSHIESFKNDKAFSIPLGKALALTVRHRYPELLKADCLVPVPIHPEKYKQRGYNQVYELAKVLGQDLHMPVLYAVIKTREVTTHSLSAKERKLTASGLYQLYCEKNKLSNKYIILIDDIITTGSTISEIAQILTQAGARHIDILALARSVY